MGMSLEDAKKATVWEFAAVAERYMEAHAVPDKPGTRLSETEKDEIWDWMQTRTDIPLSRAAARAKDNGARAG